MNSPAPDDFPAHLLADWRVQPAAHPNFRPAVWERIRSRSRQTWTAYVRAHLGAWGIATVCILALSTWAGVSAGHARLQSEREAMVVSYLGELDPRIQARLHP